MAAERILVTGGAGFVGRELVRQLIAEREPEIHVFDNLASGEHRMEGMDRARFSLHRGDIRDGEAVKAVMREVEPQTIFHLAAIHYIPACEAAPGNSVGVNVAGTVNLLDAAPAGVKFVFASTAAVYAPSKLPHMEDEIGTGPVDIYGLTKLHCENFIRYYQEKAGIRGVIVRLFNVVGSGETNPHLVPAIVEQLSDGVPELKLGNIFPSRDYIDVSDAAHGFRALSRAEVTADRPLLSNLGTGRTSTVGEVVESIARASGLDVVITQDTTRMRTVDRPMLKASIERLQQIAGWAPQTTIDVSMQRAWATRDEDRLR